MTTLPDPACRSGYPDSQLLEILGDRFDEFGHYMRDRTVTLCEGHYWDHVFEKYVQDGCGPHGPVVYPWDLERFLEGRPPVID